MPDEVHRSQRWVPLPPCEVGFGLDDARALEPLSSLTKTATKPATNVLPRIASPDSGGLTNGQRRDPRVAIRGVRALCEVKHVGRRRRRRWALEK